MHPAHSVILFTTASGAGYGMLVFLILGQILGVIEAQPLTGFLGFGLAFLLITAGLLSSTFHLGHPERAWRALTQWRSSWLSREGVAAVITYIPAGFFAIWWCFFPETSTSLSTVLGGLALVMAILTIHCTSMIYASLRTIHAWHTRLVPASYQGLGLMSGAVLVSAILHITGQPAVFIDVCALLLLGVGLAIKLRYYAYLRETKSQSTAETATGLGHLGKVSLFEGPHTESNYLMQEMGFQIARKHADKIRKLVFICGFMIPVGALVFATLTFSSGVLSVLSVLIGAAAMGVGLYMERWLFFAEAKHVVTLYYGENSA